MCVYECAKINRFVGNSRTAAHVQSPRANKTIFSLSLLFVFYNQLIKEHLFNTKLEYQVVSLLLQIIKIPSRIHLWIADGVMKANKELLWPVLRLFVKLKWFALIANCTSWSNARLFFFQLNHHQSFNNCSTLISDAAAFFWRRRNTLPKMHF